YSRQTADFTQRQRNSRIRTQRRVTAGEDESETIVFELVVVSQRVRSSFNSVDHCAIDVLEASASPQAIDCLEATGRHQPRAGVGRNSMCPPLLDRRGECVV